MKQGPIAVLHSSKAIFIHILKYKNKLNVDPSFFPHIFSFWVDPEGTGSALNFLFL